MNLSRSVPIYLIIIAHSFDSSYFLLTLYFFKKHLERSFQLCYANQNFNILIQ